MARTVDPARAAARRAAITLAAARLFAERGFEGTTAADIARAAGLSPASVFYYFPDKRAVFRSLFERDLPVYQRLVRRCLAMADPHAAILTMVDELAAEALDPVAPGILVELLRQVGRDPELMRVVAENTEVLRTGLAALMRRGIDAGTVDPELDPDEAAAWIQTVIDAAFLNADPSADPARDPRPMLRRLVAGFLAVPTQRTGETP
ncbi:DNA-binding transcriptional regulator, AcrR family [Amycolatopsis arida]|uniref:DNA-binding transcriptional regulator, AcrR family n=1 Tax=Amycolatopsis arida TaxID=587909 RepID=A0A1I5STH3_9PSEU|nr:TetR/AcrR family transcriptional regulator [Amycolatopsis arida]TDX96359.1 AcrR family transcriptional regulator [Amycolatopsis arida]SFP73931.1 DNA-binding transcriptional regulator, AcrR family [Amycolatopsis arida]